MKRTRITRNSEKIMTCTGSNVVKFTRPQKHLTRMQIIESIIFKS